jgi:hypothetical protein
MVRHDRTYHPDPARTQMPRMTTRFALYRPAYEALRPINQALG